MSSKELLVEISEGVVIAVIFLSLIFATNPVMASEDDNDQIDYYEIGAMYIEHYTELTDLWVAPYVINGFMQVMVDEKGLGYEAYTVHDDDILNIYLYNSDYYPSTQYPHMDSVDLFIFAGHGSKYQVALWNFSLDSPDPTPVSGNMVDFNYLYLHADLEWAFFISCDTLNVSDDEIDSLRISIASGGLHQFFGMHSPLFVTTDFGEYLADKLANWPYSNWNAWAATIAEKSQNNYDEAAMVYPIVYKYSSGIPVSQPTLKDALNGNVEPDFVGGYIVINYKYEDLVEPYSDPTAYSNAVIYVYLYWEDVIE